MKRIKKLVSTTIAFCFLGTIVCFARQASTFDFELWFNSGDETKSDMATDESFRFSEDYDTVANVFLDSSSTNCANSLKFKVEKLRENGSVEGVATNSVLVTNSLSYELEYKYEYIDKFGNYRLYGWTTKNDCHAFGRWAP